MTSANDGTRCGRGGCPPRPTAWDNRAGQRPRRQVGVGARRSKTERGWCTYRRECADGRRRGWGMNKREAKRAACLILANAIDVIAGTEDLLGEDVPLTDDNTADWVRVQEALEEIRLEMMRRSRGVAVEA